MSNMVKIALVGLVLYGLIHLIWQPKETTNQAAQKPKEMTETEKNLKSLQKERFKAYVEGYHVLKKQMKDPSSFDVESACVMPNMTVCYKYRAKNGFGALDLGVAFVTQTSYATSDQKGFNEAFKKECDMSICVSVK